MKSSEYWRLRSEENARVQAEYADKAAAETIKAYERASEKIKRDIEVFYARYAMTNDISMFEAQKQLDKSELKGWRMTLEEFREKAIQDNGQFTKELDSEYIRSRVSRYEALQSEIRHEIDILKQKQHGTAAKALEKIYTDTYSTVSATLADGLGIKASYAQLDRTAVEKAIYSKWADGKNFSERIWGDRNKLVRESSKIIEYGVIRGDSVDKMTKDLAARMNVSKNNAFRLIQTECAKVLEDAAFQSYKDTGCDEYEVSTALDRRRCSDCESMDEKHYKISERKVGVNAPPFHPRCRCCTVPYFNDEFTLDETRIGKDENGKAYYVAKKGVDNSGKRDIIEVDRDNANFMKSPFADKKRKAVLGNKETVTYGKLKVPVRKVENSHYNLYVEESINAGDSVIRLYEGIINKAYPHIKDYVAIPPVVLVNYNKYGIGPGGKYTAIGAYNDNMRKIMMNTEYDSSEKVLEFVGSGNFAAEGITAAFEHEVGHKYYYDSIRKLAQKRSISEYEAQGLIDEMIIRTVDTEVVNKGQSLENAISFYADKGYRNQLYTEVVAESFASNGSKDLSRFIIEEIERMIENDGSRYPGTKSNNG